MKKRKWYPLCYAAAALLAVGFAVKLIWNWHIYTTTLNSAPFHLFVTVDAIYFLIPAVMLLILGCYFRKKDG